jgi:hypothetical protein
MCEAAAGLLDDLDGGRLVVGAPVGGVAVLIGVEVAVRLALVEAACLANGPVASLHRIGQDQIRAIRIQQVLAFGGGIRGYAQGHAVPAGGTEHGVRNAGVAGGGIEEHPARLERPSALAVEDHRERGAILDGSARIARLELGVELDAGLGFEPAQSDERRPPDQCRDTRTLPN